MIKMWRALFCALLVLAILQSTNCGKFSGRSSGRHSYPSSRGGLSGSGSRHSGGHGYPSSGGSHGYPSSGGMSGSSGSHGYPSSGGMSGGSHGYPSSGGMSGGSHGYPSSGGTSGGSHGYPSSGGISGSSGSHGYPSSGGMSGSGSKPGYPSGGSHTSHTTINNHYHYTPPQQIRYASPGHAAQSYPVYHGSPPTYVYQYKNSDSKYGTLLAGLALLNLGTLGASVYTASKVHSASSGGSGGGNYKPQPGEYCKFGIKKDNGDYEETRIDCNLITSFIFQEEAKNPQNTAGTNSVVTTTVTNVTVVNTTNGVPDAPLTTQAPNVLYERLPNGTFVAVNVTSPTADNSTAHADNTTSTNGTVTSSMTVTTTTTNTTNTVNALDVKGDAIKVTPGMQCFVIRHTPITNMKKTVPCGLLQSYADQSISKKNSAARHMPTFTVLCAVVAFVLF